MVELVGHRWVEDEFWYGLGLGGLEGRGLIEEEVSLGRPTGGRDQRRLVGQLEVNEDGADDERVGEECEDPHRATTGWAEQWQSRG